MNQPNFLTHILQEQLKPTQEDPRDAQRWQDLFRYFNGGPLAQALFRTVYRENNSQDMRGGGDPYPADDTDIARQILAEMMHPGAGQHMRGPLDSAY